MGSKSSCISDCYYAFSKPHTVIDPNDYSDCNIPSPKPLYVTIKNIGSPIEGGYNLRIRIGSFPDSDAFEATVWVSTRFDQIISITNISAYAEVTDVTNPGGRITVDFKLLKGNPKLNNLYIDQDTYHITLDSPCDSDDAIQARFVRQSNGIISSNLSNTSSKLISYNYVADKGSFPRIQLQVQTTITGSDIGDAVFTIYDEFTYYNSKEIPDNTCKERQTSDVKQTIFRECCPYMVSVVKGQGDTLWDKLNYIFNEGSNNDPNVYVFYENIVLYGMTKYILSRLLYGKFNINYLLGKYNKKFLRKLSTSRFCSFTMFFNENDYNKYFLYDNH